MLGKYTVRPMDAMVNDPIRQIRTVWGRLVLSKKDSGDKDL